MADLNARNDSFISLLIDVSGRARPGDLPGMSPEEANDLLVRYQQAHPEKQLQFQGDTLVVGAVAAAAPVASAPAAAQTEPASTPEFGLPADVPAPAPVPPMPGAPMPDALSTPPAAAPVPPAGELPEWARQSLGEIPPPPGGDLGFGSVSEPASISYGQSMGEIPAWEQSMGAPAPAPAPEPSAAGYGVPVQPEASGYYGVADAPAPDYAANAIPPGQELPGNAPADDPGSTMPDFGPLPGVQQSAPKVPWYWWLIAVVFAPLGGIIGFFILRGTNPKGARGVLLVSVGLLVLSCLVGLGLAVLGGVLFSATETGTGPGALPPGAVVTTTTP